MFVAEGWSFAVADDRFADGGLATRVALFRSTSYEPGFFQKFNSSIWNEEPLFSYSWPKIRLRSRTVRIDSSSPLCYTLVHGNVYESTHSKIVTDEPKIEDEPLLSYTGRSRCKNHQPLPPIRCMHIRYQAATLM